MAGYGRYAGFVVGAVAGALLAPETLGLSVYAGAALGGSLGSVLGSVIDIATMPKNDNLSQRQPQENLAITSAALGVFIPIIRGRQVVKGNIIDATLKQPHTVEQDTGGGGGKGGFGGQQQVNRTTTYSISLAIALCDGPIERITKFWTDATLVYDEAQQSGTIGGAAVFTGGVGYAVGDTGQIAGGNSDATYLVTIVDGSGAVGSVNVPNLGTGYILSSVVPTVPAGTQPGGGSGLQLTITQIVNAGSTFQVHAFSDMEPTKYGRQTQNGCTDIHVFLGTETQLPSSVFQDIHGAGNVQAYRGTAYIVIKDLDLGTSGRVPQFQIEVQSAVDNTLSSVVSEFCGKAGVSPSLLDVSLLPIRHTDFLISNIVAVSSILENLAACYNFIGVESDGKIKFRNKSIATATTVYENLLCAGLEHQNADALVVTRIQDRELPTQVTITYSDKDRNFQSAAQTQQLTHAFATTDSPFQLNVPVALFATDAKILAETVLYEAWSSRESFAFTLPPRFMVLEPGDAIAVTSRGFTYTMRITEWTGGDNWLAEVKGVSYDASIHNGFHATPGVGGGGFVPLPSTARASALLLEPPALATSEQEPRWLFAAYSTESTNNFVSASLLESLDGGASYTYMLTSPTPAIVGRVAVALPSANWYSWDSVNTIDVVLYQRALQSGSEQEVLNGKNWAMLGSELIAFRDALLIAPLTYRLSYLLRGRKGTESFVGTHGTDEFFVLITSDLRANQKVFYPRGRIGVSELYKVIDPITNITAASPFIFTPSGVSVQPWAPYVLAVERDVPAVNDVTISWYYRSRLQGELINNSGISWDLDFSQQFYIRIYSNNTYTTVLRQQPTPVFSDANVLLSDIYSAAAQIADFGSVQATIYYDIVGIGTGILGYAARGSG